MPRARGKGQKNTSAKQLMRNHWGRNRVLNNGELTHLHKNHENSFIHKFFKRDIQGVLERQGQGFPARRVPIHA